MSQPSLVFVVTITLTSLIQTPAQLPVFRSGADAVVVEVSVRNRGREVSGLTATDFQIWDNGALQEIASASTDPVPADLTVLVDASRSLDDTRIAARKVIYDAATYVLRMEGVGDRIQLVQFASAVHEVASAAQFDAPSSPEQGQTALFDAIAVALMEPIDIGRRRVVIVLTDGVDTVSSLGYGLLTDVLERSTGTVSIVAVSKHRALDMFGRVPLAESPNQNYFDKYAWRLRSVVERTGGALYDVRPSDDLRPVLQSIVGLSRTNYVLRYFPSHDTPGWHDIRVVVPGTKHEVRNRPGYWRGSSRDSDKL
jgi:Ca-activated chloride channel family protein